MWPGVISRFAGSNARMARSSCGPNMSGLRASSEARLRLSALLRRYGPAYLSFGRFSGIGICGRVIAVHEPPLFRTDRWTQGGKQQMQRRTFLTLSAAAAAGVALPFRA